MNKIRTLPQAQDAAEKMDMIVKRVSVPIGLEEVMEGLCKEVLLKKPKDLYIFASEYFAKLVSLREKDHKYKTRPHTLQSAATIKNPNIQVSKKISPARPNKHLSRQLSVRNKSPEAANLARTSVFEKRINASKSRERSSTADRKDITPKSIPKITTPRDSSKTSNKKSGTSTGNSSVQSTPREKRQSSREKIGYEDKKVPKMQIKSRSDKVKTALVSPTVIGGSAAAASIVAKPLAEIIKDKENSHVLDSDILAKSTNISVMNPGGNIDKLTTSDTAQAKTENVDENKIDKESTPNKLILESPLDLDISSNVTHNNTFLDSSKSKSKDLLPDIKNKIIEDVKDKSNLMSSDELSIPSDVSKLGKELTNDSLNKKAKNSDTKNQSLHLSKSSKLSGATSFTDDNEIPFQPDGISGNTNNPSMDKNLNNDNNLESTKSFINTENETNTLLEVGKNLPKAVSNLPSANLITQGFANIDTPEIQGSVSKNIIKNEKNNFNLAQNENGEEIETKSDNTLKELRVLPDTPIVAKEENPDNVFLQSDLNINDQAGSKATSAKTEQIPTLGNNLENNKINIKMEDMGNADEILTVSISDGSSEKNTLDKNMDTGKSEKSKQEKVQFFREDKNMVSTENAKAKEILKNEIPSASNDKMKEQSLEKTHLTTKKESIESSAQLMKEQTNVLEKTSDKSSEEFMVDTAQNRGAYISGEKTVNSSVEITNLANKNKSADSTPQIENEQKNHVENSVKSPQKDMKFLQQNDPKETNFKDEGGSTVSEKIDDPSLEETSFVTDIKSVDSSASADKDKINQINNISVRPPEKDNLVVLSLNSEAQRISKNKVSNANGEQTENLSLESKIHSTDSTAQVEKEQTHIIDNVTVKSPEKDLTVFTQNDETQIKFKNIVAYANGEQTENIDSSAQVEKEQTHIDNMMVKSPELTVLPQNYETEINLKMEVANASGQQTENPSLEDTNLATNIKSINSSAQVGMEQIHHRENVIVKSSEKELTVSPQNYETEINFKAEVANTGGEQTEKPSLKDTNHATDIKSVNSSAHLEIEQSHNIDNMIVKSPEKKLAVSPQNYETEINFKPEVANTGGEQTEKPSLKDTNLATDIKSVNSSAHVEIEQLHNIDNMIVKSAEKKLAVSPQNYETEINFKPEVANTSGKKTENPPLKDTNLATDIKSVNSTAHIEIEQSHNIDNMIVKSPEKDLTVSPQNYETEIHFKTEVANAKGEQTENPSFEDTNLATDIKFVDSSAQVEKEDTHHRNIMIIKSPEKELIHLPKKYQTGINSDTEVANASREQTKNLSLEDTTLATDIKSVNSGAQGEIEQSHIIDNMIVKSREKDLTVSPQNYGTEIHFKTELAKASGEQTENPSLKDTTLAADIKSVNSSAHLEIEQSHNIDNMIVKSPEKELTVSSQNYETEINLKTEVANASGEQTENPSLEDTTLATDIKSVNSGAQDEIEQSHFIDNMIVKSPEKDLTVSPQNYGTEIHFKTELAKASGEQTENPSLKDTTLAADIKSVNSSAQAEIEQSHNIDNMIVKSPEKKLTVSPQNYKTDRHFKTKEANAKGEQTENPSFEDTNLATDIKFVDSSAQVEKEDTHHRNIMIVKSPEKELIHLPKKYQTGINSDTEVANASREQTKNLSLEDTNLATDIKSIGSNAQAEKEKTHRIDNVIVKLPEKDLPSLTPNYETETKSKTVVAYNSSEKAEIMSLGDSHLNNENKSIDAEVNQQTNHIENITVKLTEKDLTDLTSNDEIKTQLTNEVANKSDEKTINPSLKDTHLTIDNQSVDNSTEAEKAQTNREENEYVQLPGRDFTVLTQNDDTEMIYPPLKDAKLATEDKSVDINDQLKTEKMSSLDNILLKSTKKDSTVVTQSDPTELKNEVSYVNGQKSENLILNDTNTTTDNKSVNSSAQLEREESSSLENIIFKPPKEDLLQHQPESNSDSENKDLISHTNKVTETDCTKNIINSQLSSSQPGLIDLPIKSFLHSFINSEQSNIFKNDKSMNTINEQTNIKTELNKNILDNEENKSIEGNLTFNSVKDLLDFDYNTNQTAKSNAVDENSETNQVTKKTKRSIEDNNQGDSFKANNLEVKSNQQAKQENEGIKEDIQLVESTKNNFTEEENSERPCIGNEDLNEQEKENLNHCASKNREKINEQVDPLVSKFLNSFLENEQSNVFKPVEEKDLVKKSDVMVMSNKTGVVKQLVKQNSYNSNNNNEKITRKKIRSFSHENVLSNGKLSLPSSEKRTKNRRPSSVGVRPEEIISKSKIPTAVRRSAGRRPLVRQLETDSRDIEEKVEIQKESSREVKNSKKINKEDQKRLKENKDKMEEHSSEDKVTKEDVLIAKTILKGIEGAEKHIELIEEKYPDKKEEMSNTQISSAGKKKTISKENMAEPGNATTNEDGPQISLSAKKVPKSDEKEVSDLTSSAASDDKFTNNIKNDATPTHDENTLLDNNSKDVVQTKDLINKVEINSSLPSKNKVESAANEINEIIEKFDIKEPKNVLYENNSESKKLTDKTACIKETVNDSSSEPVKILETQNIESSIEHISRNMSDLLQEPNSPTDKNKTNGSIQQEKSDITDKHRTETFDDNIESMRLLNEKESTKKEFKGREEDGSTLKNLNKIELNNSESNIMAPENKLDNNFYIGNKTEDLSLPYENKNQSVDANLEKYEDFKRDQLNIAATKIQKTWKGYNTRKNNKTIYKDDDVLEPDQENLKRSTKRTELQADDLKAKDAAVKIQSIWRGFVTRKMLSSLGTKATNSKTDREKSIIKIQAVVRGYLDRVKYQNLKNLNIKNKNSGTVENFTNFIASDNEKYLDSPKYTLMYDNKKEDTKKLNDKTRNILVDSKVLDKEVNKESKNTLDDTFLNEIKSNTNLVNENIKRSEDQIDIGVKSNLNTLTSEIKDEKDLRGIKNNYQDSLETMTANETLVKTKAISNLEPLLPNEVITSDINDINKDITKDKVEKTEIINRKETSIVNNIMDSGDIPNKQTDESAEGTNNKKSKEHVADEIKGEQLKTETLDGTLGKGINDTKIIESAVSPKKANPTKTETDIRSNAKMPEVLKVESGESVLYSSNLKIGITDQPKESLVNANISYHLTEEDLENPEGSVNEKKNIIPHKETPIYLDNKTLQNGKTDAVRLNGENYQLQQKESVDRYLDNETILKNKTEIKGLESKNIDNLILNENVKDRETNDNDEVSVGTIKTSNQENEQETKAMVLQENVTSSPDENISIVQEKSEELGNSENLQPKVQHNEIPNLLDQDIVANQNLNVPENKEQDINKNLNFNLRGNAVDAQELITPHQGPKDILDRLKKETESIESIKATASNKELHCQHHASSEKLPIVEIVAMEQKQNDDQNQITHDSILNNGFETAGQTINTENTERLNFQDKSNVDSNSKITLSKHESSEELTEIDTADENVNTIKVVDDTNQITNHSKNLPNYGFKKEQENSLNTNQNTDDINQEINIKLKPKLSNEFNTQESINTINDLQKQSITNDSLVHSNTNNEILLTSSDERQNVILSNEKPSFYRSNTVVEPQAVKKEILHLGDEKVETKNNIAKILSDNIELPNKDNNNNSHDIEETELEKEVRSAVNAILNNNTEKLPLVESEIKEAVKNIMENNIGSETSLNKALGNKSTSASEIVRTSQEMLLKKSLNDEETSGQSTHHLQNITSTLSTEDVFPQNKNDSTVKNNNKQNSTNEADITTTVLPNKEDRSTTEMITDDVSSVDSMDSFITVIPNVKNNTLDKTNIITKEFIPVLNKTMSHEITKDTAGTEITNQHLLKKSLSAEALKGHVDLIDQVQNTILDRISGKPAETGSKFDIDQLRKELEEAASLYKSEDDSSLATHDDELLEYLNDFELEDNAPYDSRIIRTPIRELPDIEEESDSKDDDVDPAQKSENYTDKKESMFCGTSVNMCPSGPKIIDNKPLEEHIEAVNLKSLENGHNEIIINNDNIQINGKESNMTDKKMETESIHKLLHTSELHDSVVIPMNSISINKSPQQLQHTSEFHDTLVVPLPSGSDVKIINEAVLASDVPSAEAKKTESVDSGNQTAYQQAPAGAAVVTSQRSSQDGVEAQAPLRDTSPTKPTPAELFTHQSPQTPRFVEKDMESENNNNKRNNAISNVAATGQNMEVQAATKIQAGFRGYQVRKQMKSKNAPTDKPSVEKQPRRKSSGRKSLKDVDLAEKSAVKIQAGVRGFLVRRRQKKQINSSASA